MAVFRVTEIKDVKIDRDCKKSPVFISWTNTAGGREHWLFSGVQTHGLTTSDGGHFEPYKSDIENSRGQIKDVTLGAVPLLICSAYLDIEDIEGLKTVTYSPNVEMLMNPLTWSSSVPPVWQIIRPVVGSFKIRDTDMIKANIEVTFLLPYINNISQ